MQKLKLLFKILFCIIFGTYFLVMSILYFNQESLIFHESKLDKKFKFVGFENFNEMYFNTTDGVKLHGILFKSEHSKGLVFYLHGNAGNLDGWGRIASKYTNLNYDIFILDYRGFGKSEGEITSELQLYNDVSFVYKQLTKKYKESEIIISGYSIGSGLATYLASKNRSKSLLLQAPYYNFETLAKSKFPLVPSFLINYKIPTFEYLKNVKCPVYVFHGDTDNVIPYNNSVELKYKAKPNLKLYKLKNQSHLGINDNEVYLEELKKILLN